MNIELNKLIAEIIKKRRKELGMTQQDLANDVKLSVYHISNIENSNHTITIENLYDFSKALKCTMQELLPTKPKTRL